MKIKDLITELQKHDPEMEFMLLADEFCSYHPKFEIRKIVVRKWGTKSCGDEWYEDDFDYTLVGHKDTGEIQTIISI